ncbi:hypothetical protein CDLVIII_4844 [Clostridium sp. DL-VIII]|uniref:hypothetical protein n=1 Tax=Clostridium sp. DL-VIII TaxID=641107 RepID=UPI00023B03FB|nr:hypothetical protein [Clostridium sp. DL-VIII]EHJ01337.1 hypothetical protein CDLVIII_4844 [Clostridium sp. DL-VIII]
MEEKSILIQSDEVTKNMMSEIQEDMNNILSKISKNMSEEVIEKLRPIEKKISDLKMNFQEFQEDDFEEKLDELNDSISKTTKSMESTIAAIINKSVAEQNKVMFEAIEERLAILGLKVVKDAAANKEAILNKIDDIKVEKVEEKVDALEKAIDEKVELLGKSMGENSDNNADLILGKIKLIDNKIKDKDIIVELISKFEDELNERINDIQEEVEWGNKSFFARLFGKRRR